MNKGKTKELHWGREIIISQLETGDGIGAAPVPTVTGNNDLLVFMLSYHKEEQNSKFRFYSEPNN
jgi:hypothetical protein